MKKETDRVGLAAIVVVLEALIEEHRVKKAEEA